MNSTSETTYIKRRRRKKTLTQATENLTLGEYIHLERRRQLLSIRDLTALTGVSPSTISRIENNKESLFVNVCQIAKALRMSLDTLAAIALPQ